MTGNTVAQILGKSLIFPLRLALLSLLARLLNQKGFGEYSLVITVVTFLTLLVDLGVSDMVVREASKRWGSFEERLSDLLILKTVLSVLAVGAGAFGMALLRYSPEIRVASFLASLTLFFTAVSSIGLMAYRVRLELKFSVLADLAAEITYLLIVAILYTRGGSLYGVLAGFVFSRLVHALCMTGIMIRRYRPRRAGVDLGRMLRLIRVSFPVWVSQVMGVIYGYVDILMLSRIQGEEAVGVYSAAATLIQQSVFVPLALVHSVFPLLCRSFIEDREAMKALFQKTLDLLLFLALPTAAGVTLFSDEIVFFLYGAEFAASAQALRILIWAGAGMYLCTLAPLSLIALQQQNKILIFGVAGVGLNVGLNLLWIPAYSYVGASLATLVTELGTTIPALALICVYLRTIPSFRAGLKIALATGLTVCLLTRVTELPVLLRAGMGVGGFLLLSVLFRTFSREDLRRALGR